MNKKEEKKWYASPSNWVVAIACILLVPMLLVNLWIMVQSKTNQDAVPSVFGYKPFMVLSGSMEGQILKGDLIITKIIDPETLKVGDIIAFRDAQGTITTHRIIDEIKSGGQRYFITKGDNNKSQDQNLVELGDVEGIYVMRIPGVGSMMKSLSEPTTIIILVVGITVIFGIGFVISNKKQQDKEREEFLEYKKMKELEAKMATKNKKVRPRAVEYDEEDYLEEDDEDYFEEEEEEMELPKPRKLKKTRPVVVEEEFYEEEDEDEYYDEEDEEYIDEDDEDYFEEEEEEIELPKPRKTKKTKSIKAEEDEELLEEEEIKVKPLPKRKSSVNTTSSTKVTGTARKKSTTTTKTKSTTKKKA